MSTHYNTNELNVEYISEFIEKSQADRYFAELRTLPFYTPTLRIRGKDVKPKRKVIAYGDSFTSYAFSGTSIPALPWTPLLIELRDKVEKQTGCVFNYVLLNCYSDGTSYISQHKDNEPSLNDAFPITVLSFGSQRTLEFKRPGFPSTLINLEHGSLYSMMKPTNELFTHGIASDPAITEMRISLTFRHLSPDPQNLKKSRLDFLPKKPISELFTLSSLTKDDSPFTLPDEELPANDWLSKHYQQVDKPDPIIAEWPLNWCTYIQVTLENLILRVHIRQFNESANGKRYPTKRGVTMTCSTFDHFQQNLVKFHFFSVKDTFIANNQLLVGYVDEGNCLLQQIFKTNEHGFHFKPEGLRLSNDQFFNLCEVTSQISDCLIDTILTKIIPQTILNKTGICHHTHVMVETAKEHFFTCLNSELERSVNQVFDCYGCATNQLSQLDHNCLYTSLREKFVLYRESALLNFHVEQFVKKLFNNCTCYYNYSFFEMFTSKFYESYLETVFIPKKNV